MSLPEEERIRRQKRKNRLRKLWMLPLSLVLLAGGIVCLRLLYLARIFTLPAKATAEQVINTPPVMDRDSFIWVPPTEPETEPPEDEEIGPGPYDLTVDLAKVQRWHNGNGDVIGWVRIKDTAINYPIMQTDNNWFYTDHNSQGQFTHDGAIFADYRCSLDNTDNALVYGHNLANGTMLHAIKNYKVAEWGRMHPYIEVASLSKRYLYRVLSVNVIYGEEGAKFDYWNYINMNRAGYRNYLNNIRSTSQVWYGDEMRLPRDGRDRIIALQTCNSGANDGIRCVVFAQCLGDFTDVAVYDEKTGRTGPVQPPQDRNG